MLGLIAAMIIKTMIDHCVSGRNLVSTAVFPGGQTCKSMRRRRRPVWRRHDGACSSRPVSQECILAPLQICRAEWRGLASTVKVHARMMMYIRSTRQRLTCRRWSDSQSCRPCGLRGMINVTLRKERFDSCPMFRS